jgi:hypothetical protein
VGQFEAFRPPLYVRRSRELSAAVLFTLERGGFDVQPEARDRIRDFYFHKFKPAKLSHRLASGQAWRKSQNVAREIARQLGTERVVTEDHVRRALLAARMVQDCEDWPACTRRAHPR